MPDGFAHELERAIEFHKRAPSDWDLCVVEELLGQDQERQICAAVANQLVELRAVVEPILQRVQLTPKRASNRGVRSP